METKDETGIDKGHEKRNKLGIVKKDQYFWNIVTWNVRGLVGKKNELIEEFKRENLDILGNYGTKKKGSRGMEMKEVIFWFIKEWVGTAEQK